MEGERGEGRGERGEGRGERGRGERGGGRGERGGEECVVVGMFVGMVWFMRVDLFSRPPFPTLLPILSLFFIPCKALDVHATAEVSSRQAADQCSEHQLNHTYPEQCSSHTFISSSSLLLLLPYICCLLWLLINDIW